MMKKITAGFTRKALTAVVAVVLAFAGLGLIGYSLFAGDSSASAESPERVHGRITEELEEKFQRSIPERIVEAVRVPQTPESKKLELTIPAMDRVDGVPVYDAPKSGYGISLAGCCQRLHRWSQGGLSGDEEQPRVLGPQPA